jgi:hypothetical protein
MAVSLKPRTCPECYSVLALDYEERRQARMSGAARTVLIAGIVASVVLLPSLFVVADVLAEPLSESVATFRRERRVLRGLIDLLSIPVALLPAWLGWRLARSRPRLVALSCPECAWVGICRMIETNLSDIARPAEGSPTPLASPPAEEFEVEGIPNPENPARKRLERVAERRRKKAREEESDSGPNPEFDFGSGSEPRPPDP